MKTMKNSILLSVLMSSGLTAVAANATELKAGSYRGRFDNKNKVHMLVRAINGREDSYMAVLYQFENKRQRACLYMVDPLTDIDYAMIPLSVAQKDGEIVQGSDKPALILSVTGKEDGMPKFTVSPNKNQNGQCNHFAANMEFKGDESKFSWTGKILNGRYKLQGLDKKAGAVSQSVVVDGDTSQQATANIHPRGRGGVFQDNARYTIREKAPGFFTLKGNTVDGTGSHEDSMSSYIGFYAREGSNYYLNFVHPFDHKNVWRLKYIKGSGNDEKNDHHDKAVGGKAPYVPVVATCGSSQDNKINAPSPKKYASGRVGTEVMTEADVKNLAAWARRGNLTVQRALIEAAAQTSMVAKKNILRCAMENASTDGEKLGETMFRYALSRGLDITKVIDEESGVSVPGIGPVPGTIDQQVRILTHTIGFALEYFEKEFKCDNKKCVPLPLSAEINRPFDEFGLRYVKFLMDMSNSLYDATAQYEVLKLATDWFGNDLIRNIKGFHQVYSPMSTNIYRNINDQVKYPYTVKSDKEAVMKVRDLKQLLTQSFKEVDAERVRAGLPELRLEYNLPSTPVKDDGSAVPAKN